MKKTPKYAQIEAELIAQIESGQLAPGAELPSESDLIECYGVSRVTVRRAIDELYHQGYVEKMQGKRACVKEKVKLQELTSISSYTEEIIRQGIRLPSVPRSTDSRKSCMRRICRRRCRCARFMRISAIMYCSARPVQAGECLRIMKSAGASLRSASWRCRR